jgi:hypothetical protein
VALANGRPDRSSPRLAPRVPVHGSGADGAAWCAGEERQRRFCSGRTDLLATCGRTEDAPGDARAGRQGRDRWSMAGCTAARDSRRSRRSRHREASRDLGKARTTSGTRTGGAWTPRRRQPAARRARRGLALALHVSD